MNANLKIEEISIESESFPEFLQEVQPLLPLHWEELALNKDKVPLAPQYDQYLHRWIDGQILLKVVRKGDDLIGYFIGFVVPGLHYKTCIHLHMDIFYIHPDHRGAGLGMRLFKEVEAEAKARGVQRMFLNTKWHKSCAWLYEKLGYEHVEQLYSVWLGD
jgi:GNAT superfamily N-acetyltransferase